MNDTDMLPGSYPHMLPGSYPHITYMVVWSETSYSGDKMRCYNVGRTITKDRATQPMEAGGWVSQLVFPFSRKLLLVHPCITQLELRHLLTQRFPAFCYRFDFHYQLFSFLTKSTCYRFPLTKLTWVLDFHHRLLSFLTRSTWNLILSFEYNTLSVL